MWRTTSRTSTTSTRHGYKSSNADDPLGRGADAAQAFGPALNALPEDSPLAAYEDMTGTISPMRCRLSGTRRTNSDLRGLLAAEIDKHNIVICLRLQRWASKGRRG